MSYEDEVKPLRAEIDRLNQEILDKLRERVHAAVRIGELKKRHGKPVRDPARETRVLDRVAELAEASGLDPAATRHIFREIIELCAAEEESP